MAKTKRKIRRTTIELTDEQYFFLKEKSLALQKQNKSHSIISIIRDLIEKDREKWMNPVKNSKRKASASQRVGIISNGVKEKKSYGASNHK